MKSHSQRGVALVTTLIMLSLITFTAVVFLAITSRERNAVVVTKNETVSRFMNAAGISRAEAEVIGRMKGGSNKWDYGLLVSQSYPYYSNLISYLNNDPGLASLTNLQFDSRPPVYVPNVTNSALLDYRFYLDFNRNGQYEVTDAANVGDPHWIGVLERPEFPHSSTNRFTGRYAYIVLPAGKSLDLNFIHNYAKRIDLNMANEGFFRNQGTGSWEMNLAAFLAELNNAQWGYDYTNSLTLSSFGNAFTDANSLLSYRYSGSYTNLDNVAHFFGPASYAPTAFLLDNIDAYTDGPLQTGFGLLSLDNDTNALLSWSGGINLNSQAQSFFDVQQLFNSNSVYAGFTSNLFAVTTLTNAPNYDPYAFYKLVAQMGTDSAPPPHPETKINLNYDNVNYPSGLFTNWTAYNFFTNVADRLIRTNLGLTIVDPSATNAVLIYPGHYGPSNYTAEVHRLLQVAANLYDSTTNAGAAYPYFPSVFRPLFFKTTNNFVTLAGYAQVTDYTTVAGLGYYDPEQVATNNALFVPNTLYTNINIYGVPWVVGAKKGLPNFNEISVQTIVQAIRRMEIRKKYATNGPGPLNPAETNLQYVLSISNAFGVEAWNSYAAAYPRPLTLVVTNVCTLALTNEVGAIIWPVNGLPLTTNFGGSFAINSWPGFNPRVPVTSFKVPFSNIVTFLPNSVYTNGNKPGFPKFTPATGLAQFETNNSNLQFLYTPQWGLSISNRLVYILMDSNSVIDYVNIADMTASADVAAMLQTTTSGDFYLWDTNRVGASTSIKVPTTGMNQQIAISLGQTPVNPNDWQSYSPQTADVPRSIATFQKFMGLKITNPTYANTRMPTTPNMQVPFTPVHVVSRYATWQVNDPLVHYTLNDVTDFGIPALTTSQLTNTVYLPRQTIQLLPNLARVNERYSPWGGNTILRDIQGDLANGKIIPGHGPDYNEFNSAFIDPMVTGSDAWDFPTNKFPGLGDMGRVHRGTPWQTIYLKATVPSDASWLRYTGSTRSNPTNDWTLPAFFTTGLGDNSVRGLLSVNQTNAAAWAAVLGGVMVISNTTDYSFFGTNTPAAYTNLAIAPASPQLQTIVNGIIAFRNSLTNQSPAGVFTNMGQILGVSELTEGPAGASPFINLKFSSGSLNNELYLPEVAVERIPQQILSLLTLEDAPRIVIYSFGQVLRPASQSVVLSGPNRGMVTNYEITGETVTRTVVRIEGAPANPRAVIESYNVLSED